MHGFRVLLTILNKMKNNIGKRKNGNIKRRTGLETICLNFYISIIIYI